MEHQYEAPKDDRLSLKVKLKSLAEEARIIRKEEDKLDCTNQSERYKHQDLHSHRINVVRPEARATLLAYAYIRGRTYRQVEPIRQTDPSWHRVRKMVEKYGPQPFNEAAFVAWQKDMVYVVPQPIAKSLVSRLLSCAFS